MLLGLAFTFSAGPTLGRAPAPEPASAPRVSFGVNLHPLQYHYAVYPPVRSLQLADEIGASVVRIDIHWEWIDYMRHGGTAWTVKQLPMLDAFLAEAARRHLRVLATVVDTPCWASSEPGKQCPPGPSDYQGRYPPTNPQDYAHFLSNLVHHVGHRIQYYEIWNEPNIPRFWAQPDAVAYTRLLRAAYRAIKAQDPRAQVLAGATSGADGRFVTRMYKAGAKGYFDALSVHPYSGSQAPDACSVPRWSFRCGVEQIRRVMLQHGDTRPIWLTELGESVSAGVDPATQARYLTQAFSLIRRWRYVRGALWYELYDDPSGHDGEHFGLFQGDLCPRPAAWAFRFSVLATTTTAGTSHCRLDASTDRIRSGIESHRHYRVRLGPDGWLAWPPQKGPKAPGRSARSGR